MRNKLIALLALLLVAASAHAALTPSQPAPDFTLHAMSGSNLRLQEQRGRVVLVNFWATWCEPCRAEMPSLEQLAASQRDTGLRVIAVNFREGEPAVRRFIGNTPLSLPIVRDADGAAARAFGINIFPSTVAIDRQGRTRFIVVGELDWSGPQGLDAVRSIV